MAQYSARFLSLIEYFCTEQPNIYGKGSPAPTTDNRGVDSRLGDTYLFELSHAVFDLQKVMSSDCSDRLRPLMGNASLQDTYRSETARGLGGFTHNDILSRNGLRW